MKILVCDDENHVARLIQVNLEAAGHDVEIASDGRECLNLTRDWSPDLLFLDIMMPLMDGFEVLRLLRSNPFTENVPVIMISARCQDEDAAHAYRCGADMFLTKPFNPREFLGPFHR